ncbi:glycosyltransferase family 4 protein [Winogradskyella eckloniae]|uniref:glycosyltransferase family 4 protein n=1 Tax=Winogradskyella eckloniae TaxID=1089306 RepID=UPI0015637AEC|nr:glycosyltransferase family 4 protein [Winogradskyella eckloniae]NRD20543.1 glycosyltransferase family 4 protein [Winogradskyella eckloniae]
MPIDNKQILIVTSEFPPQPGGIGNHAYQLALALNQKGFKVKVIADERSLQGNEETEFDLTLPFSVIRIQRDRFRLKMYLNRIIKTYKNFSNSSHVIATGKFSLWNVAFISLFKKAKTLAVIHGTEVNFKPILLKKSVNIALKRMDTIVAVSNYTKHLVQHLKKAIVVIPNGINCSEWQNSGHSELELKGNPVITTVGRVSSRKGQLNVIKHLPELLKYYPELHYHCIGIPSEADHFRTVAADLNVQSHITFHGALEEQQLKQALKHTDIFVMLSSESKTGDVEGFGIAILEANAIGVPAIGALNCGIEDAVQTGVSGVLINSDDSLAFKEATDAIINAKDMFSKGAVAWANQHDWAIVIERYIALLS